MLELRGTHAFVSAGASGIGQTIATTLADHGAKVAVCDVDQAALDRCREERPDLDTYRCDVADEAEVDALFHELDARWGALDILVNNAGIAGPTGPIDEITAEDWRRTVDVNLNGIFYVTRRAVPLLKRSEGTIINLSSVAGRLGYALRTPYSATKWAIVGLTQSLAKELGPSGIRVNAIQPGIVAGPRIDAVIQARAEATGKSFEEIEAANLEKVSLRRKVTAEDVANMALFLCAPAGRNISGQAISVCGNVEQI